MNYLKKSYSKYEIALLISIMSILFLWNIRYINDIDLLFALPDEFGYWSIAAFFAGYDWSGTTSYMLYYNWGYSIILVPLFWIFKSTFIMRKAAIIINAFLISGSFVMLYSLGKKIFKDSRYYLLMGACLIAFLYPEIQVQANMTMCEIFVTFLMLCFIYFMYMIIVEKKSNYIFCAAGCACWLYFSHQRNLACIICFLLMVCLMKCNKNITWKKFFLSVSGIILGIIVNELIKNYLQKNLWLNGTFISINDFGGITSSLGNIFTIEGMIKFFGALCGQLLYLIIATYGLFAVAIIFVVYELRKRIQVNRRNQVAIWAGCEWELFLILVFLGIYGISTIFMREVGYRYDTIIYGRYTEPILPFFIMFGMMYLFNISKNKKTFVFLIAGLSIWFLTGIIQYAYGILDFSSPYYNTYCAVSLPLYPDPQNGFAICISSIYATLGLVLIMWGTRSVKFRCNVIIQLFVLVILCGNYVNISNNYVKGTLIDGYWGSKQYEKRRDVVENLENLPDDAKIYFLYTDNGSDNMPVEYYQFLILNREIYCIRYDDLIKNTDEHYVVIGDFYEADTMFDTLYEVCDESSYIYKRR